MDCSNPFPDPRKSHKNQYGDIDKSVQFWGEARGESRKISVAMLNCAPHSDTAESAAISIWERMTPEHYRLISETERLLSAHNEIRVAVLRETLGRILEALNVDVKELRAISHVPIEALTLLLNQMIKIYNMNGADVQAAEELVPLSERIKEQASRAEKHGFGSVKVTKNMYVNERAKLAMIQTQLLGRLKLKSGTGAKMQNEWKKLKFKMKESCKKDESKRKLRHVVEIKEKLKDAQEALGGHKTRTITYNSKLRRCQSRVSRIDSRMTCSSHETTAQNASVENLSSVEDVTSCADAHEDTSNVAEDIKATIDTSSWVISPTHEYYFGSSPPVIPKNTVTHEVYPKPVESKIMEPVESVSENFKTDVQGWEMSRDISKSSTMELASSKSAMAEYETGLTSRYMSTASSGSFIAEDRESANCEESHGDASTIFAWTEPEKSASYCLNTIDKIADATMEETTEGVSDAAGDGCDLARTLEESNMEVLKSDDQDMQGYSSSMDVMAEVSPPRPFSMTDVIVDTDYSTTSNESLGAHKRNLFSCNESMCNPGSNNQPADVSSSQDLSKDVLGASSVEYTGDSKESLEYGGAGLTDNIQEKIHFEVPPAEPNEEKINGSHKKSPLNLSGPQMNKNVIDELTVALKRSAKADAADNQDVFMGEYGSSTSASETNPDAQFSSSDPTVKIVDDVGESAYSLDYEIPVPPPMPPPPIDSDQSFGLQYYGDGSPHRSVDNFQSASDFRGTQVLYMRPPSARKKTPQRGSVNRQENESDENQTTEAASGRLDQT